MNCAMKFQVISDFRQQCPTRAKNSLGMVKTQSFEHACTDDVSACQPYVWPIVDRMGIHGCVTLHDTDASSCYEVQESSRCAPLGCFNDVKGGAMVKEKNERQCEGTPEVSNKPERRQFTVTLTDSPEGSP